MTKIKICMTEEKFITFNLYLSEGATSFLFAPSKLTEFTPVLWWYIMMHTICLKLLDLVWWSFAGILLLIDFTSWFSDREMLSFLILFINQKWRVGEAWISKLLNMDA